MRKRIRKVLIDAALVSGLVLFGHECGDEVLFKTEEEKNLEDKLEMPINLDWELRGEERSVRIRQLESYLDIASENWDLYSQQFSNINYISITSDISLFNPVLGSLHYFCSEKQSFCYSDQDIVHELGHLWYFSLSTVERSRFERFWKDISGDNYWCSPLDMFFGGCDSVNDCHALIEDLATVSCYGTTNLWEDVAEYFMFVYLVNKNENNDNEDVFFHTADNLRIGGLIIYLEAISRIIDKINLLYQYGAFSERERNQVVEQLMNSQ